MITEYLKNNILICDGAMGTYYSELSGNDISYCEFANLNNRDIIKKIHCEYIEAGAKLIRTNTFSANTYDLGITRKELKDIISEGINIAEEAVGNRNVYIGASIGPIRNEYMEENDDEILEEYKFIVDCFIEKGIDIFIFETFSSYHHLDKISEYIKKKNKNNFILTQFAFKPDGYTRDGVGVDNIFENVKNNKYIDAYGMNCGSGSAHLLELVRKIKISKGDIVSILPNAGFPEIIHERTVYPNNPIYFARRINDIRMQGAVILGGCCGTNPLYIKEIKKILEKKDFKEVKKNEEISKKIDSSDNVSNTFKNKLKNNEFVIAVELTAPVDTDVTKLINSADICKKNKIDLVTVPDSPMSRVRADSVLISAKIKREIGIEAMPHVCCRDKNTNAIRSSLIGAHIENIRNVLAITGDPVSDISKVKTKSVFNLNSFKLINLINTMNTDVFFNNGMLIGGALNPNVRNKHVEYERMKKKIECGASFFLTQPIYDEEAMQFIKEIKEKTNTKILGGILPIVSYRNAVFLNNELPGVNVPECIVNKFKEGMPKEEAQKVGMEIAVDIGRKLKDICDGLYFIVPFNRVDMIMEIVKNIR
ncbi:bifunctional homocysteine S-methyltransferase/methylenetetrahydrofolate reductase [Clostridium sp. SM-530-WT-3G]|uniref:bifunctional homocysteine S-methyltransferase/methylenetetrahydrofolate reductase n=1 Tax=Clostridium sp. SM-530-WT-3G TaxID=2725303 RepID=UPI00145F19ED|nr:bifunctional homocysteine S-methyltransferase/methylenetetrahydrofolate reductase [Clostridium sp. SM-530-WT-3G]NME82834.1 bifunctional homocysteine S-methyltransferase/methylenetetrahydrofolate reductase [Clostridium sp. SM-530-WT-3G]